MSAMDLQVPMRAVCTLFLCATLSALAGEPPPHGMIELAYFECVESHSLQGGIFGKGPLRRFGPVPGDCAKAQWKRISRGEFKSLATAWYGVDWTSEAPFFSRGPAASQSDAGASAAISK